ncbi:hypothetical protein [Streptomyces sp. NPDC056056]|uniref:hypothetical protein n=1 Tax=Streptomyces sp. NPDC056056 TaxID=3345698 RepID=UPI0035D601C7
MSELIALADSDAFGSTTGGIIDGLTDSLSEKRLTQIEQNQLEQARLLKLLATHLGVQPRD